MARKKGAFLNSAEWSAVGNNPHLKQLSNSPSIVVSNLSRIFQCPGSPKLPYRRRSGESKSVCHWGQRKLILSEIEFFTEYVILKCPTLVIYAGAAPGHHIPLLSEMFPNVHFLLFDPSAFEIEETDRIRIFNEFFTEELARQLFANSVSRFAFDWNHQTMSWGQQSAQPDNIMKFFISDVRTADWTLMSSEEVDAAILEDLHAQAFMILVVTCPM